MINEKNKVDNQAISEGAKDKMPVMETDFGEMSRDKDRNVVMVNLNLGGQIPPKQ